MDTVNDAGLMKLSRDAEQFLKLLLAEMIQHARVHHIRGEALRILCQTEIGQPLGAYPGVAELGDAGIPYVARVSVLLDGQAKLLPMKGMGHA